MLDINYVRSHPEEIREMLRRRNTEAPLETVLAADDRRRALLAEAETLKARRNAASKEIGRQKDSADREAKIAEMKRVGDRIAGLDEEVRRTEEELQRALSAVPNLPDPRTPVGRDENENVVLRASGEPRPLPFEPKAHWDLGPALGILNFEQGARMTGSRFYVLHGAGALLQRALISWMVDLHIRQGYREVYPPYLVREEALYNAGQLPKFADNLYHDSEEDLWMVPTAEVPLTNLHAGEILEAGRLPLRYTAYTACFRREKMAAGRDVRGIKRGHQFDKVEMYEFARPEEADAELERMLADAEAACRGLGLTYRVKQLCTGDLGFCAARTYDLEVWSPGVAEWLEVSSVSHCGDFQARRAGIRYRPEKGAKPEFVHTFNGSGLALPRTMIAVMENYQTAAGGIAVPEVLRPWMGGIEIIRKM
ncbi:MAG: serine--tRNA ligase [Anaerolineales bacterium]|nr:serine--tRNA ligase [Anaerolineales bacterium]